MKTRYDFIIIGSGPAGLAAALTAAEYHLSTIVIAEQANPGGQVYRDVERADSEKVKILGSDYRQGLHLVRQFRNTRVDYLAGAAVWQIEPDLTVDFILGEKIGQVSGKRILIATGAIERPVPIPGWTLPGVVGVGGLQALVKRGFPIAGKRIVVAGSGPLLLAVAAALRGEGGGIVAVAEQAPGRKVLGFGARLVGRPRKLIQGLDLLRRLRGIPLRYGCLPLRAEGANGVETVTQLDAMIRSGRVHENEAFEDYFAFDHLEAEREVLLKSLMTVDEMGG